MDSALRKLERVLGEAIAGMSLEDLRRHPQAKWSAEEILDHLNLTYRGTIKNFERTLARGTPTATVDRRTKRWLRLLITRLGVFPPGRAATERVLPRGTPAEQLKQELFQNLARMEELIGESERRFGGGCPLADHPMLGPLTGREWRNFHLAHGKLHARQITRLKR